MRILALVGILIACASGFGSITHFLGETTIGGEFMLKQEALEANYGGVTADNFGTTTVTLPGTDKHPLVRDMQYTVGQGVGYVPVPVKDGVPEGSATMDVFLRAQQGLGPKDQIFAIIVYLHPEEHSGNLKQLATEFVKTEAGQTHLGIYIGNGATRNSPEGYHRKVWGIMSGNRGYPATVQTISLEGVPQALFNRNAYIAMALLNKGVQFPSDYKKDMFRTIDLATTLRFYRDWLLDESYLRQDNSWKTYCAEHVTIIVNVALNVPQNENSYKTIWGETKGAELYKIARQKFADIAGPELSQAIWGTAIEFTPLWKRRGITKPAEETTFAKGMAWPAQTNADIMVNFLEAYASWPYVGAPAAAATAFGFRSTLVERMSSSTDGAAHIGKNFDKLVGKAAGLMFVAEAMTINGVDPAVHFERQQNAFYVALGGEAFTGTDADPRWLLAKAVFEGIRPFHDKVKAAAGMSKDKAYIWFRKELEPIIKYAREVSVLEADAANNGSGSRGDLLVRFNSPPAITHRVAIGVHPSDSFVTIKEVATAINADHLRTKTPEEKAKLAKLQAETAPTPRGCSAPRASEENPDCMSYRQLQMACMRLNLNPCNGRKAVVLRKVKDAMSTTRGRRRRV